MNPKTNSASWRLREHPIMSTFVLTEQSNADHASSPACFFNGSGRLSVIFTERRIAARFHELLPETDRYTVVRLNAMELLRELVRAHDAGVHYLCIDPEHPERMAGKGSRILAVDGQLAEFAELLTRNIVSVKEMGQESNSVEIG